MLRDVGNGWGINIKMLNNYLIVRQFYLYFMYNNIFNKEKYGKFIVTIKSVPIHIGSTCGFDRYTSCYECVSLKEW